jgi:phosphatidylserine decarboxylase
MIRQIAGIMARRIVTYATQGERVEQGDELGFIKFGSRVDILLPTDIPIDVELKDKSRAMETIIAHFNEL